MTYCGITHGHHLKEPVFDGLRNDTRQQCRRL
jgi:hypothetical protein